MFPDVGIQVHGESKRGNAVLAEGRDQTKSWTRITGDPGHECFAFRRCLSVFATDRQDLEADHAHALAELSAPLRPCVCGQCRATPPKLQKQSHEILQAATSLPQAFWLDKIKKQEGPLQALKAWLQEPHIDESPTWKELFESSPPRGVLKRLSRRIGVSLHPSCQFQGYDALSKFRAQLRRIKRWFLGSFVYWFSFYF